MSNIILKFGGTMQEKKTVLIRVAYMVELPEKEINSDNGILDKITREISESKNLIIDEKGIELHWNSTSSLMLDSENFNSGKCSKCGQWVTDREKPDAVEGLCNGATVDGKLLCDECLPSDHRWAF